jgi:glycosyltransferase involved in cell wall biosynthesis
MKRMHIWYLNHYAKPAEFGTPGRSSYLSKYLQAQGHDTLIVAASDHHTRIKPAPTGDIRNVRLYDGIKYFHIPTRSYSGNGPSRLLNMLDYARGISMLAKSVKKGLLEKPDVIIASSVHNFVYPPAYRLAKKWKAKIIFEVRDIWPLSLIELAGIPRWHPLVLWMSHIENRAYRTADAVVSLVPKAYEHMEARGLNKNKYYYIPNGINSMEWEPPYEELPESHQNLFTEYRKQGKLIVIYAGAHGPPNALDQILDLQKEIGVQPAPYHFILIGDGVAKHTVEKRVSRGKISFVSFLPRIPKAKNISAILQADVCFMSLKDSPIFRFGVSPNKLGDYLIAGRPDP